MHELSLAAGIFDIVRQYVPADQGPRVRAVRVRIGDAAAVLPDSLAFCFEAIVTETPYSEASLVIEEAAGDDLRVVDLELVDELEA